MISKTDQKMIIKLMSMGISFLLIIYTIVDRFWPTANTINFDFLSMAQWSYLSTWILFQWYAYFEGGYDAKKILNHRKIKHTFSWIIRVLTGVVMIWMVGGHIFMELWQLIIAVILITGAFSFMFTFTINSTRGISLNYFPEDPNPYDRIFTIFPDAGKAKFLIEFISAIGSLIYLFLI